MLFRIAFPLFPRFISIKTERKRSSLRLTSLAIFYIIRMSWHINDDWIDFNNNNNFKSIGVKRIRDVIETLRHDLEHNRITGLIFGLKCLAAILAIRSTIIFMASTDLNSFVIFARSVQIFCDCFQFVHICFSNADEQLSAPLLFVSSQHKNRNKS